jgi:CMP-N,N'-diacetyllegionaminic acid synthase
MKAMINGKTVLGIIPARGSSKGLLRKNITDLAGKPLIAYTINEAKKSRFLDRLILSSDDTEIISIAATYGCETPFIRPAELASDTACNVDVMLHAISLLPIAYDYIVMLQPTSPLRTGEDIDACIEISVNSGSCCVSVAESNKSPHWMYKINEKGNMEPFIKDPKLNIQRQYLPKSFTLNGAVYVSETEQLKDNLSFVSDNTIPYVMPQERSVDIDTWIDLSIAEILMNKIAANAPNGNQILNSKGKP